MAMVANGLVPRGPDGITRIRFETTAGLVVSEVASEGEQVLWTRFENVPAYVAAQDIPVELPGYGALSADIVGRQLLRHRRPVALRPAHLA